MIRQVSVIIQLLALLLLLASPASSVTTCLRQLSTCSCETADGVIDLAPLSLPSAYPFSDSIAGGQDSYQWSPCIGQLCSNQFNTAVCNTYVNTKITVGQSDTAKFVTHPARGLQLVYTDTRPGVLYTSYVILVCDPEAEQPAFSFDAGVYDLFMHLRSRHACPNGGQSGGGGGGGVGLSTGDILCIVLVLCIVLYLGCGLLLNKFFRGKQGVELVPNKDFWTALPGYVKDGCLFTAERLGCRRSGGITGGYEAMR